MARLNVTAIGDISFNDRDDEHPSVAVFSEVIPIFRASDIVIANLESPLLQDGTPVAGKCSLRGSPDSAKLMKEAGIHVVSLANNHSMDFGDHGLSCTIEALKTAHIQYLGAGSTRRGACAPLFFTIHGRSVALLARTSVPVSSPSYATDTRPGVALLEPEETIASIRHCKARGALVVLLLHWGVEEYSYPSAQQRALARNFTEAGLDLLIGHHPHVLQGVERIGAGLVSYSLGNFLFRDVHWSYSDSDGQIHVETSRLTDSNRRAGILRVVFSDTGPEAHDFFPTRIRDDGRVALEASRDREEEFRRLCARLRTPGYPLVWRAYSLGQEWRMRIRPVISGALSLSKVRRLRFRHLKTLVLTLHRSTRIALEKTTNPYE